MGQCGRGARSSGRGAVCWSGMAMPMVLLLSLFVVAVFEARADDQEPNTIRMGDDYEIMKLPRGAVWQDCRKRCQDDERCAAWTFVRERTIRKKQVTLDFGGLQLGLGGDRREVIPAQCRLKYAVPEARRNSCCVSGVKRVATHDGHTHGRRACVRYAEKSIAQYDSNLAQRCGFRGERWHGNFRRHYRYCKNTKPRRREAVLEDRADALAECRTRVARVKARCERYARAALRDFRENRRLNCAFGESRLWGRPDVWHRDRVRHFQWCAKVPPRALQRRAESRAEELSECRVAARVCDDFAARAVRHQRRNLRLRCGFKGPRWNTDRDLHHERCMKMAGWRRNLDLQARRRALHRCRER